MKVLTCPEFIEEITLDNPLLDCLTAYYQQRRAENDFRESSFIAYRTDLMHVVRYLEGQNLPPTLRHLTRENVRRLEALWVQQGHARTTIARRLNSLQAIVRYCRDFVPEFVDPFAGRRIARGDRHKRPDCLSEAEYDRVLGPRADFGRNPLRNRALLTLMYFTLCRLSEAAALTWGDVDFRQDQIHFKAPTKNHDPKTVPMAPELKAVLRALQRSLPSLPRADAPVFVSEQGVRFTESGIKKMVKDHGIRNGVPRLHSHLFRHTGATRLACQGVPLPVVAKLAGHHDLGTTMKYYIHVPDQASREAVSLLGQMSGPKFVWMKKEIDPSRRSQSPNHSGGRVWRPSAPVQELGRGRKVAKIEERASKVLSRSEESEQPGL